MEEELTIKVAYKNHFFDDTIKADPVSMLKKIEIRKQNFYQMMMQ